jgi:hypothetical protein
VSAVTSGQGATAPSPGDRSFAAAAPSAARECRHLQRPGARPGLVAKVARGCSTSSASSPAVFHFPAVTKRTPSITTRKACE